MSSKVVGFKLSKRLAGLSKLLLVSGFLALIYSLSFVPTVSAAGGVGGGGSGSGGTGAGHYTTYGWGWAVYSATGSGPTDGFRNGTTWASVQSACAAGSSSQVYANVVYDTAATGMVYDYQTAWAQYSHQFSPGSSVDKGNATAIAISTAESAFNNISKPPYNVDTTGFSFGTNVGWFCYNYTAKNWTIGGTSTVSPTTGLASTATTVSTATFTHVLKNAGPDDSKDWKYYTSYKETNSAGTVIATGKISTLSNETGSAALTNGQSVTKTDSFQVPISWTAGYKRCEWITWDSYKSPAPTTGPTSKATTPVCFTVVVAGAPVVTIDCTVSGGVYTISGSAYDPDKAGALSIQYFKEGSTSALSALPTTNSTGSYSLNVTPFMGQPPVDTGFYVVVKGIGSSGAQQPPNTTSSVAPCTVPPCVPGSPGCPGGGGPTPTNCPGDATISANSKVTVALPDKTPANKTAAPSGYTTDPYATQEQDVPLPKTMVTSVQDISIGGARVVPSVVGNLDDYQTVTLQYQAYVDGMPYDPNQASVTYDSKYQRTDWYVVYDHYQCDGTPASLSGGSCSYNYAAPSNQSCSSGQYFPQYGKCLTDSGNPFCPAGQYESSGNCYKNTDNSYVGGASCTNGSVYYGSCYTTSNPTTVYYCNNPSNEYVSGSTCYGSYGATAYYRWTNNGTYNTSVSNTVDAYAMNACFNRNYDVTNVTASASFDNNEDPSNVSVSGTGTVDFIIPVGFPSAPNGLRTPVKVNLSFSAGPCPSLSGSRTFNGTGLPSSGSSGLDSGNCSVSAPPLAAGNTVCIVYNVFPKMGEVQIDGTPVAASGTASSPPGCTSPISNSPYVHILGADASAGGNFATGILGRCVGATPDPGTIIANLRDDGTALSRGSGDQFGALALGAISRYASASYRTAVPTADRGLTFANPPPPAAAGNLGGQHCVPDFFSTQSTPSTAVTGSLKIGSIAKLNSPGNPDDRVVYSAAGDITIGGGGGGIARGNRVAIYADGDVYITDDITFKSTSWPSDRDVPSFFVIAKGNIYISPNVSQLDGVYVAQPSATRAGIINTCAPGFGRYLGSDLFASCIDKKLTVNGAFVAGRVDFLRTSNSLRNALGGEYPINPSSTASCNGNVRLGGRSAAGEKDKDCAAEVINFSPETFLSEPALLPFGGPTKGKYDFITSLSPIL